MQTSCQPCTHFMPTLCTPHANLMQTSCQPHTDLVSTLGRPCANFGWSTGGGPLGDGGSPGGSGVQGVVGSRDGWDSGSSRVKGWQGFRVVGVHRVVKIQGVLG